MAKPKFKLEWYADEVVKAVGAMTHEEEKAAADRIVKRAKKYVPVGSITKNVTGNTKTWKSRRPGRLKASIKRHKSKYKDGGYTVFAGDDYNIYYAHFIEYGTIFMEKRKGYKFLRKAVALEKSRFVRQLRKNLGV